MTKKNTKREHGDILTVGQLIYILRQFPSDRWVEISVDVSTGQDDFDRRAFGEGFFEISDRDANPITLCFKGDLNYEVKNED